MPHFAANLTLMFTEVPFLERFGAAKDAGFDAVEFLFPYAHSPDEVGEQLNANELTQALFNAPPGDWDAGERGIAALPGREDEFKESIATAVEYARALKCSTLHVMSGIVADESQREGMFKVLEGNLQYAADICSNEGITIALEPLNARDVPDYLIGDLQTAADVIERVGRPNIGIQFDYYHTQITEGDLATHFSEYFDQIVHVQISGVPERHEPNIGEINYGYLFQMMDRQGYLGFVGCEYNPIGRTQDGLGWLFD